MLKISALADWNIDSPGAVLAKFSSRGLHNQDLQELRKIAGESFADKVRYMQIEPGLEPVYQTALAASETHGYNRNGDGYTANMLNKRADTFVTHGRLYRNHKAKDPNISYGIIKHAEFDPRMGVVHVLGGLFKDAETARKFGGGNPADEELEALAKSGSYPVSQGSSIIGGDKCVICGKVSTRREDYCTAKTAGGQCDLFGCRDGLSKIAEDGRHQALDNPDGIFHDLSKVGFPAVREAFAYALAPGDLHKAASGQVVPGIHGAAWLADIAQAEAQNFAPFGLSYPEGQIHKAAQALAQIESRARQELKTLPEAERDLLTGLLSPYKTSSLAEAAASDNPSIATAAVKHSTQLQLCVPPSAFFAATNLADGEKAAAIAKCATLFQDLADDPVRLQALVKRAACDQQRLHVRLNHPTMQELRAYRLDPESVQRRALEKLAEGEVAQFIDFQPTLSKAAQVALDKYAVYRLRVLSEMLSYSPKQVEFALQQANLF